MIRRIVDILGKVLDRAEYLVTLARLSILDRLAGAPPETRLIAQSVTTASDYEKPSRRSISTIPVVP